MPLLLAGVHRKKKKDDQEQSALLLLWAGRVHTLLVDSQQVEVLFWRHLGCRGSLAVWCAGCRETSTTTKALAVFLLTGAEPDEGLITRLP